MKKSKKMILTIILILVLTSAVVVIWQYENISVVLNGLTKSSEDIASEINKKRDDLKIKVEKYTKSPINDLTAEDEQKLLKGEISLDEVAEKYNLPIEYMNDDDGLVENVDGSSVQKGTPAKIETIVETSDDNIKKTEKEIGDSVSRMYALKAKYVNKLGELEREVIDLYSKLPKSKQNKEEKKKLVMANLDYVAKLEKTCDADVEKVISALEKSLKDLGGNLEIIQILKDSYKNEKELKKSYYLSLYSE